MRKLKNLNNYLSNAGLSAESMMIGSLMKRAESNFEGVFSKIVEVLEKNFFRININFDKSGYDDQSLRIIARRYFTKETEEGAEFRCKQDLLIRLTFLNENKNNVICFVKSTLSCPNTLNGDFESQASESIDKEQRKIFGGQVAYEIKDMIISISNNQLDELLEFVNI